MSTAGVAGQALYSFMKMSWENNSSLIKYPFPMNAITNEQFEFINGWLPSNDATRKLIRTAGWAEYGSTGSAITRKYAGIITLGSLGTSDQVIISKQLLAQLLRLQTLLIKVLLTKLFRFGATRLMETLTILDI